MAVFHPAFPAIDRASFHADRLGGEVITDVFLGVDGPLAQVAAQRRPVGLT